MKKGLQTSESVESFRCHGLPSCARRGSDLELRIPVASFLWLSEHCSAVRGGCHRRCRFNAREIFTSLPGCRRFHRIRVQNSESFSPFRVVRILRQLSLPREASRVTGSGHFFLRASPAVASRPGCSRCLVSPKQAMRNCRRSFSSMAGVAPHFVSGWRAGRRAGTLRSASQWKAKRMSPPREIQIVHGCVMRMPDHLGRESIGTPRVLSGTSGSTMQWRIPFSRILFSGLFLRSTVTASA